jgi:ATP-dependent phosphofructokinase / diphosphate-dependent phosphofructokinase
MNNRVGILTGGGDAPGLNAVIRAFVKYSVGMLNCEVFGIEDAFNGLLEKPYRIHPLELTSCKGLIHRGGTILGTTNRGDPFNYKLSDGSFEDRGAFLMRAVQEHKLQGLVVIGGDGTQSIAYRLMQTHGVPVIGVPKTIDNDLQSTDFTFGFQSAVDVATEALDRLHTTAESHERVMFLEVMGRDAGHIALWAGIAGGADCILIPEIPYDPSKIAGKIRKRSAIGRPFTIIVVAEGALPKGHGGFSDMAQERKQRLKDGGGAAAIAMAQLEGRVDAEMRCTVLGHLQRGGSPVPFDRVLATRFGVAAADLVQKGEWGKMVCLKDGEVSSISLKDAVTHSRLVEPEGSLVEVARRVGVEFGA